MDEGKVNIMENGEIEFASEEVDVKVLKIPSKQVEIQN